MEPKEKWEQLKRDYKKEHQEIIEEPVEVEETEARKMTYEEKKKVKKEMMGMLWLIAIIIVAGLVFIFGFKGKNKNNPVPTDDVVETSKWGTLKNGAVPVDDPTVKAINEIFVFETINPLYEENILKIYTLETTSIEEFDISTKMLFLTSTKEFKKLVEDKGLGKDDKKVSVTTKEIDEIAQNLFNKDIDLEYQNFKYYIEKDGVVTYYDAVLKDGKYTFEETTGTESKFEVYSKMVSCYKEENLVYIESKIVFVNETGIYSNPEMTDLIGQRLDQINSYVNNGYRVKFTYEIKNTGNIEYYFSETKTTSNAGTPDYDFDYEEEVKESEKEHNKK